jgi:hypothetical protein
LVQASQRFLLKVLAGRGFPPDSLADIDMPGLHHDGPLIVKIPLFPRLARGLAVSNRER